VPFHQDPLRPLGDGAALERVLEIAVVGEPAQGDVDRALPVVVVLDVRKDAALRRFAEEGRVGGVHQHDHRARRSPHDRLDQAERVLGAFAEPDERHVRALAGGDGSYLCDLDLVRDHLVAERRDHRGNERKAIPALVGDEDAQVLDRAIVHACGAVRGVRAPK